MTAPHTPTASIMIGTLSHGVRTALLPWEIFRSGACGASTRGELAPPWTPQVRARRSNGTSVTISRGRTEHHEESPAARLGRGAGVRHAHVPRRRVRPHPRAPH